MILFCYPSKKEAKAAVGKPLRYSETSMFGPEYKAPGKMTGAYRPSILGMGGREWFGTIEVDGEGLIVSVS